jgi:ABC-type uncharacterized transport system substrate-binding protein
LHFYGAHARRRLPTLLFALIGLTACAPAAFAHPHVWATVRSEIVLGENHQITGIRQNWTFDEFYTAMAVEGLDTNKDGVYSKEELAPLAKVNVDSLKEFDYFTFVHFDGEDDKLIKLKPPVDYWIDYDKNVLTLHFTLPLEKPVDTHGKPVAIDVYDPSFFVAFGFATENPVKLAGADTKGCDAKILLPDPETAADTKALTESFFTQLGPNSNFGSQFAQTVTVSCKDSHL